MNDEIQKRLEYLALVSAYAKPLPIGYQPKVIELHRNCHRVARITDTTHVELVPDEPALFEMRWDGEVVHAIAPSGRVLINRLPIEPAF